MLRKLALVAVLVAVLAPKARAFGGIGIQGGLYTPTGNARALMNSDWQVGLRTLLPPYTPIGPLNIPGLSLDVGLDLSVKQFRQLTAANLDTQLMNLTAVYRYTFPIGDSTLLYLGLGGRVSALWGQLSKDLKEGSLLGHLRGALSAAAGFDYVLGPSTLFDVRLGYGILGFTSWEATGGLLLVF